MKLTKARLILLILFLVCFVLSIVPIIIILLMERIYNSDAIQAILKMLVIYSIYLTTIIGGIFGRQQVNNEEIPKTPFYVALLVSIIWNLLILWRPAAILFEPDDSIENIIEYFETVTPYTSFLITGALGYFFATKSS